ncbi:hypothetical protein M440DRAFT_302289 [Trichoderma longibrachiatum ATCC 18648]|uniref:Uncharacterized protein n=1 Tax=Trichoderma longibrachiatum ATCC 18648 TaxID=983965 RepID=A0A2T4C5E6_TRILO|nr:hypothetical protein M440DRAFT_302289 [Trichoderma longibrachiatum ATCC 18648]
MRPSIEFSRSDPAILARRAVRFEGGHPIDPHQTPKATMLQLTCATGPPCVSLPASPPCVPRTVSPPRTPGANRRLARVVGQAGRSVSLPNGIIPNNTVRRQIKRWPKQ